jgi:hypothetical protein
MTVTRPWRRITLHFSQIGLTLGRTFMSSSWMSVDGLVVGRWCRHHLRSTGANPAGRWADRVTDPSRYLYR